MTQQQQILKQQGFIIRCNDRHGHPILCNHCHSQMVKNPLCSGDYYPTQYGTVLMTYCPNCGRMKPLIEIDQEYLSNNRKKKLLREIIIGFNLQPPHVNKVYHSSLKRIHNLYDFIWTVSESFDIDIDDVRQMCI